MLDVLADEEAEVAARDRNAPDRPQEPRVDLDGTRCAHAMQTVPDHGVLPRTSVRREQYREGHCSQRGMLHDVKRSVLVSRSQPSLGLHLDHHAAVRPVMHRRPLS